MALSKATRRNTRQALAITPFVTMVFFLFAQYVITSTTIKPRKPYTMMELRFFNDTQLSRNGVLSFLSITFFSFLLYRTVIPGLVSGMTNSRHPLLMMPIGVFLGFGGIMGLMGSVMGGWLAGIELFFMGGLFALVFTAVVFGGIVAPTMFIVTICRQLGNKWTGQPLRPFRVELREVWGTSGKVSADIQFPDPEPVQPFVAPTIGWRAKPIFRPLLHFARWWQANDIMDDWSTLSAGS